MNKKVLKRIKKLSIEKITTFFDAGFNVALVNTEIKVNIDKLGYVDFIGFDKDVVLNFEYEKITSVKRVRDRKLLIVYTDTTEFQIKLI